jgi:acyl-CoA synthetase (AMP-forming)/AMP-acid ligase II
MTGQQRRVKPWSVGEVGDVAGWANSKEGMYSLNKLEVALRQVAKESPERLAVQFRDRGISYSELAGILTSLSSEFGDLSGRRVVLLLPDGLPSYCWYLHLFLRRAVNVPISVAAPTSRIKALCKKVKPHFIVTNNLLSQRHRWAIESYPRIVVKPESSELSWGFDYEAFGIDENVSHPPSTSEGEQSGLRMIVFTSGSTGEPKGVCLSENNLLSAAEMMLSFLALSPSRKSLVTVPLYDYYGFIQIYGHLLGRSGYIFGESIGFPNRMFKMMSEEEVTDLVLVPFTLRELLRRISLKNDDAIRKLKIMTSSSDLLTPELLTHVFELNPDLRIFNIYGLTEAGRACYREIRRSSKPSKSIGRPSPGVEITLENSGEGPGEIVIRGPNVMLGYLQDVLDDQVVFEPCSEMHTGDLGYYDGDGEIILLGRRDHMINIRGSKMHPTEIETCALEVPGVFEAHARKVTDGSGEDSVMLDVVLTDTASGLEAIHEHVRRSVPPLFCPREINIVERIQRTELGSKIIRRDDNK